MKTELVSDVSVKHIMMTNHFLFCEGIFLSLGRGHSYGRQSLVEPWAVLRQFQLCISREKHNEVEQNE